MNCANPPVQPYSLKKAATVTTDASEKANGGVPSQEGHPVIYVSRKLTPAEQNYSNIEREALAIVFVVTRLKQFPLRRRFTLQTDHKALKYLFAPDEEIIPKTDEEIIPKTASARITMGNSSNGFRLWVEVHTSRADIPCRCFEQNGFWRRRIGKRSSVLRNQ